MLLAVEGGGFFSSSASGYTSGLSILLLGRRSEEKPIRVSSWNQYEIVEQDVDPSPNLSSKKTRASCGCTSCICFNCQPTGLDGSSSAPKVGPARQSDGLSESSSFETVKVTSNGLLEGGERRGCLKSSLKKPFIECSVIIEDNGVHDSLEEVQGTISYCAEVRKVHWTDAYGKELAEIREFELSDGYASDDDSDHRGIRRCLCAIQ